MRGRGVGEVCGRMEERAGKDDRRVRVRAAKILDGRSRIVGSMV